MSRLSSVSEVNNCAVGFGFVLFFVCAKQIKSPQAAWKKELLVVLYERKKESKAKRGTTSFYFLELED
jgi:hypothetical protein